jgi:hypothetical protein
VAALTIQLWWRRYTSYKLQLKMTHKVSGQVFARRRRFVVVICP